MTDYHGMRFFWKLLALLLSNKSNFGWIGCFGELFPKFPKKRIYSAWILRWLSLPYSIFWFLPEKRWTWASEFHGLSFSGLSSRFLNLSSSPVNSSFLLGKNTPYQILSFVRIRSCWNHQSFQVLPRPIVDRFWATQPEFRCWIQARLSCYHWALHSLSSLCSSSLNLSKYFLP